MKKVKKIFAIMCVLTMVFAMTACGNTNNQEEASSADIESTNSSENSNVASEESVSSTNVASEESESASSTEELTTSGTNETLVAYFSYSGNTEEVAQQIADYTGGTLAQIERATPYTDVNEEGEEELNSNARPEITVNVDGIENYNTIFIGYPIWWDEAPMVIDTFLESYDFTGKTIVPFCTSASDSIDNSLHIFGELAPGTVIAEGLTANDSADIEPWLNSLGYSK